MAVLCGVAAISCGDKEPEYPENPPPTASAPPVASTPPPPPATAPCSDVQAAAFLSMTTERAKTEAVKMDHEGGVVCGVVNAEGGKIEGPTFVLQPGHCYTVLANGIHPVTDVEAMIVGDPTAAGVPPALAVLLTQPLAVESDAGQAAKINCFKWAWPVPVGGKVVLKAKAGTGPMGAQVYRKKAP